MRRNLIFRIIPLLLVATVVVSSCGRERHDAALVEVSELADADSLDMAASLLEKIDRGNLSDADRHFHDFLLLKVADLRYVKHESDSLYLSILEYYKKHTNDPIYPEVLYYGGRVYSDIGDYPTALDYFLDAQDALEERPENLVLKSKVLSQTGRLLNQVRLYSEAEKYLSQAIEMDRELGDEINTAYDLQLLGINNYHLNNLTTAKRLLSEGLVISDKLDPTVKAKVKMALARVENKLGNKFKAIDLIRDAPYQVKTVSQDWAVAFASEIYYSAGVYDTAYIYARKIVDNPRSAKQKTALSILLTPELIHHIPIDSLAYYIQKYSQAVEENMNQNDTSQISLQLSAYNYKLKQREIEKAKKEKRELVDWIILSSIIIVISTGAIFLIRYKNKRKELELQKSNEKIRHLQDSIRQLEKIIASETSVSDIVSIGDLGYPENPSPEASGVNPHHTDESHHYIGKEEDLRLKLREELREVAASKVTSKPILPVEFISSSPYLSLREYIKKNKSIPSTSELWKALETEILKYFPNFLRNLSILMNGKETIPEIHTALLIKSNLTPTEQSKVLGLSPGGVGSRRDSIAFKIFEEKVGAKLIDSVIRLL